MVAQKMLEGNVLWSYDHELKEYKKLSWLKRITGFFSSLNPVHQHEGNILLASNGIFINGDQQLEVPIDHIEEVYMGFDEDFPASSSAQLGLFWQPLRIRSTINRLESQTIYLVINRSGFGSDNQTWFNALISLLRR